MELIENIDNIGKRLAIGASERDRSGSISPEVFADLRAEGLTSALVPVEFGGGGATFDEMGQILRALARYDASTAVTLAMHTHLVAAQVWRYKHGIAEAEKVLRKVADGAVLVSTGASDWIGSNGVATRVEGGYRVSARKGPASGCEVGQILVTSVRWDAAPDGPQVIHCAIPFDSPNVRIDKTWDTLGLRATGSHTVVLNDVFVPDAAVSLIRAADQWHPVWNTVLGAAMPLIMAAYLGIADAALEHARAAAAGRAEHHVLHVLGEVINAHTVAEDVVTAMLASANDLHFDNTDDHAGRTLSRKSVAAAAAIDTVRLTLALVGGSGYSRSNEIERLFRDVNGSVFHPLPLAKQTLLSARVALGGSPVG